mgnify:CR=1 FL=1
MVIQELNALRSSLNFCYRYMKSYRYEMIEWNMFIVSIRCYVICYLRHSSLITAIEWKNEIIYAILIRDTNGYIGGYNNNTEIFKCTYYKLRNFVEMKNPIIFIVTQNKRNWNKKLLFLLPFTLCFYSNRWYRTISVLGFFDCF